MISYEVAMGFILATVILCTGSMNLSNTVVAQSNIWYIFPLLPSGLIFFISCLAETNRHPFDLPEAEAELVSGYNVEYSAMGFALFFLGEYSNMILMSSLIAVLFLGGWNPVIFMGFIPKPFWFSIKILFLLILFVALRAALPRYRYDQLMHLGWKVFLPFSIGWVLFVSGILVTFDWLPF